MEGTNIQAPGRNLALGAGVEHLFTGIKKGDLRIMTWKKQKAWSFLGCQRGKHRVGLTRQITTAVWRSEGDYYPASGERPKSPDCTRDNQPFLFSKKKGEDQQEKTSNSSGKEGKDCFNTRDFIRSLKF